MDCAKLEIVAIEQTSLDATEAAIGELSALELTLVGGGSADPIFH